MIIDLLIDQLEIGWLRFDYAPLLRRITKCNKYTKMPCRDLQYPNSNRFRLIIFKRKKNCQDHTIMLGVYFTYVPMVTNYRYLKATTDESQV